MQSLYNRLKSEEGSVLTEFAVVVPIFMLLITALFIIGLLMHSKILLLTAVAESARELSYHYDENLNEEELEEEVNGSFFFIINNGVSKKDASLSYRYDDGYCYLKGEYHFLVALPIINELFDDEVVVLEEEMRIYVGER